MATCDLGIGRQPRCHNAWNDSERNPSNWPVAVADIEHTSRTGARPAEQTEHSVAPGVILRLSRLRPSVGERRSGEYFPYTDEKEVNPTQPNQAQPNQAQPNPTQPT